MREQIGRHRAELNGPVVVVTGGFHSSALVAPSIGISLNERQHESVESPQRHQRFQIRHRWSPVSH